MFIISSLLLFFSKYLFKNCILIYITFNFFYSISDVCFFACVPSLSFCISRISEDCNFFLITRYTITNNANKPATPAKKYKSILLCSILMFTSILCLNINFL